MKKLLLFLAGCVLAPAVLCAAEFEGRVNFKMTPASGKSQEVHYAMKNGKIRIEMPGQRGMMGGMILDPAKRETTMIMDEQKMYMTMPMPDVAQQVEKAKQEGTLEKTGETEKILGFTAEKYLSTYGNTKTELWLAEGLGSFIGFSSAGSPMGGRRAAETPQAAWEKALAGKALFPLRVVSYDKAGKEAFRMEATAVEKQALPEDLFTPPADYQKFDMGGMMKGMMPGRP